MRTDRASLPALIAGTVFVTVHFLATSAIAAFTFVAIPDTQYEVLSHPQMLQGQVNWILNNQASQNIAFVAQLGDITQTGSGKQYALAHNTLFQLSSADNLPWGTCRGNHDTVAKSYIKYFGTSNFVGEDWYGGASADGLSSYQTFDAEGRNYLVLDLEYHAPKAELNWAQSVISAHPGMPTIINTHAFFGLKDKVGAWGKQLWSGALTGNNLGLVNGNPQVFMVLCGHELYDYHTVATDAAGQPVYELMSNYQSIHGGDGYMRLFQFDEADSVIHAQTYSPTDTTTPYLTNSANQFDIPMNFDQRLGAVPQPQVGMALAAASTPEPSTMVLVALGGTTLFGFCGCKRWL